MVEQINQTGAGRFVELVAFDKREVIDDGYGNEISGDWLEQFQCRAEFRQFPRSETVIAARLESRGPMGVNLRVSGMTKQIDTDWRMRDVRRGIEFNIRDVQPQNNRVLISLMVESGVATG